MKIVNDLLFSQKSSIINAPLGSKYTSVTCKKIKRKLSYMKNLKLYGPFLWMGLNSLKATQPLQEDSLLFSTQSPGVPGTYLINYDGMKEP